MEYFRRISTSTNFSLFHVIFGLIVNNCTTYYVIKWKYQLRASNNFVLILVKFLPGRFVIILMEFSHSKCFVVILMDCCLSLLWSCTINPNTMMLNTLIYSSIMDHFQILAKKTSSFNLEFDCLAFWCKVIIAWNWEILWNF